MEELKRTMCNLVQKTAQSVFSFPTGELREALMERYAKKLQGGDRHE